MERGFEKISFGEFKKSVKNDEKLYESIMLPIRKTSKSAGYDFIIVEGGGVCQCGKTGPGGLWLVQRIRLDLCHLLILR